MGELTRVSGCDHGCTAEVTGSTDGSHFLVVVIVGVGSQGHQVVVSITRLTRLYSAAVC